MKQIPNCLHQSDDYQNDECVLQFEELKIQRKNRNGMECDEDPVAKQNVHIFLSSHLDLVNLWS